MTTPLAMKKWLDKNPEYMKEWYKKNRSRMIQNSLKRYRRQKETQPWLIAYRAIKTRARQKNIDFNLDEQFVKNIWRNTCPVLGIPLYSAVFKSGGGRHGNKAKPCDNSPTIDRIDPSKGYTKDNVCIMSYRANMIKNCGTLDEHKRIVDFLSKYT